MKLSLYGVEVANEEQAKKRFCSCDKNRDDTWEAFCVALSRDWSVVLLKKGIRSESEIVEENVPHALHVRTERFAYDVQISLVRRSCPISVIVDSVERRGC